MQAIPGMETPDSLPSGTVTPLELTKFSEEHAIPVPVYTDGVDQAIVIWNLLPGQENESHMHPFSAHTFLIMEGEGLYVKGEPGTAECEEFPVKAGQVILIPREQVHGIKNTGTGKMSYFAVTTTAGGEYKRIINGEEVMPHG
ncbi:MAG: cupin domain-containing protein [Pseudomonadota bacterium]|nr:cupin domain-containing protein [Pseudomonadota bacterium]